MKNDQVNLVVRVLLCVLCGVWFTGQLNAQNQQRGFGVKVQSTDGQSREIKLYDGSYALVIGIGAYTAGWDPLPDVRSDIEAVKKILGRHGFTVETAEDLTRQQFDERIRKFIDDYGYQSNNRLLIYFAGHGHTLKSAGDGRELGYIVPADAPLPSRDETGFRRKAISLDVIQTYAKEIQAKHALFVFDSCFSGKLVSRNAIEIPPFIQENVAYPVRQFITAGAANQIVPDVSIFRRAFVRGLEGEADRNRDGYITGTELADYLKEKVTNYSERRQTPQYGKINDIELDRGDFVFAVPRLISPVALMPKAGAVQRNSMGMEFVYVPAGSFVMGISEERAEQLSRQYKSHCRDSLCFMNETPQRRVTLKDGFWMGRFEVTEKQWRTVMGNRRPNLFDDSQVADSDEPMTSLSLGNVAEFIKRLNQTDNEFEYRLPTEAEWEYAARAGAQSDAVNNLDAMAWYAKNSGDQPFNKSPVYMEDIGEYHMSTHPVGKKKPNAFGLYDMLGNASEFVQDIYSNTYEGLPTDGTANLSRGDTKRSVLRGGMSFSEAFECRPTFRDPFPVNSYSDTGVGGFRLIAIPRN